MKATTSTSVRASRSCGVERGCRGTTSAHKWSASRSSGVRSSASSTRPCRIAERSRAAAADRSQPRTSARPRKTCHARIMAKRTLFAYVDGTNHDDVVAAVEERLDALVANRKWISKDVWVVNQREPDAWDLGLNLAL